MTTAKYIIRTDAERSAWDAFNVAKTKFDAAHANNDEAAQDAAFDEATIAHRAAIVARKASKSGKS